MAKFTQNYGQHPLSDADECLVDSHWLLGLSGGNNQTYQNGLTATGTNQATAFPVPSNVANVVFSSVPSGSGASLPSALPGVSILIFNHDAANALTLYPDVRNNPITGNQDVFMTTGGSETSVTVAKGLSQRYTCGVAGIWN